ncbi:hypothetical protein BC936DRAFT_145868 [Jimgerdemannia flammicorona]|uniref:Vps52-domain-containing protein n=1 Tax=Jimgerdemannia flammicorona TaxID=994334 RepID=A0A433D909_9FUNG|nr:hypothetical protein BC936DRAFT_145868 [Jimgerdemannia flammicorona]
MIRKITESDVDEAWLNYLLELNKKMTYVKANVSASKAGSSGGKAGKAGKAGPPPIRALKDVGPELERLRIRASGIIRDFFLNKIRSLRIPNTNIQILQQSVLLKYKELHRFLMERHGDGAAEVRQTYVNTMRWYFYNHFERYSKGLGKLQAVIADKTDLIGVEESAKKGLFGTGKVALKDKTNVFALGDRIETLRQQDAGVILVHVAEDKSQKYPYEALFRSFNLTMIDNASSEYLFIVEFFATDNEKMAADLAKSVFHDIFEPTEKMGLMTTKQYVDNSYDAVGILLCIRINTQLTMELQRRRVPALEAYTNATNMLLWPRFQHIMDLHFQSVKKMAANKQVLASVRDVHPHYVTRRYAEFAASILTLNEEYSDPNLNNSLQRLRNEVEGLLARMANELSEHKNRIVFLINNYDLIASVLKESAGKTVEAELEHVNALLSVQIGAFVDEELIPYFGNLVNFVKHAEQVKNVAGIDADRFEKISYEFNTTWRQNITSINASVIQLFSNFKNGTTVLHAVLGQLIVYYTRFCVLLEQRFQGGGKANGGSSRKQEAGIASWKQPPVGVQTVMVEIKKFRSNF